MGEYVKLGDVTTWYDELGNGEPLVLLHGAHVDARFFEQNVPPLAERFHVFLPERRGHGHTADEEFDIEELVQLLGGPYAEVSPDGIEHFRVVAKKTIEMAGGEPSLDKEDLAGISSRTLVMFGDDDLMTLEHVGEMYDGIPDAELAIVPGTSHFLLQEKPDLCNAIVLEFLTGEVRPTIAPVRRAGRPDSDASESSAA